MLTAILKLRAAGHVTVAAYLAIAVVVGASAARADQACPGDGDESGHVTVDEIVVTVGHALDGCPPASSACNGDADCDGMVIVSEIILVVNHALTGCPEAFDLVVDVPWLRAHVNDPGVQILDARIGAVVDGHIPGALSLSPYSLATTVEGIPFQVVGATAGAAVLSGIGIREDATVVVYGIPPEFDPARVVWALQYLGHADARYLDGGWNAWVADGAPIEDGPALASAETNYEIDAVDDRIRVTGEWVLEQLGEPPYDSAAIQLVDARSTSEFAAGRIPTALNVPWTLNIEGGLLLPREQLTAFYADLGLDPSRTTVTYCLAGWRASVAWLVLTWLGFEDVRVYDGSWLEWGEGEGFPIEVDP